MYESRKTWSQDCPPTATDVLDLPPTHGAFSNVSRAADEAMIDVLTDDTDPMFFVEDDA